MISVSKMKEKTRWPTLDCSRNGSSEARVGDLLHGDGDAGAAVGLADGDARQGEACGSKPGGGDQATAAKEHGANSPNEAATLCRLDERSVSVL